MGSLPSNLSSPSPCHLLQEVSPDCTLMAAASPQATGTHRLCLTPFLHVLLSFMGLISACNYMFIRVCDYVISVGVVCGAYQIFLSLCFP